MSAMLPLLRRLLLPGLLMAAPALQAGPPAKAPEAPAFSGTVDDYWSAACARCHGASGNGRDANGGQLPDAGFDFTGRKAPKKSDSEWFKVTKEGKEKMPAFKDKMNDRQINQMISKLRSFAAQR